MLFEKRDIESNLIDFVQSGQFQNFKLILEDASLMKFKEMQTSKKTYDEMLADKALLNFYMSYPDILERKVQSIAKRKEAELKEKVSKAQEELG